MIYVSKFANHWNHFWFEKRSRQSLSLLRIFFGSVLLMKLTGLHGLSRLGDWFMLFPAHTYYRQSTYYLEGFRHPIPGLGWLPVPTFIQHQWIDEILFVMAIFFVVGLFTRYTGPVIAILYTYLFLLSQFTYRHHVMLFVIVLLILGFSRCADHYSLDSYIRGKEWKREKLKILPIRLIQVLVSIAYFFSFFQKLNKGWWTGEITLLFHDQGLGGDFVDLLNSAFSITWLHPLENYFWRGLGIYTLFAEGLLSFGLWIPRLRLFTLLIGVMLHLGIDLTLSVSTYSFQMWALYIAFICPESGQHIAVYDGRNITCRQRIRIGKLFDWLQRVRWLDWQSKEVRSQYQKVGIQSVDNAIVVITPDGEVKRGFYAFAWLIGLFPVTFVPSYVIRFVHWLYIKLINST